jgi:ribosomal protein L29
MMILSAPIASMQPDELRNLIAELRKENAKGRVADKALIAALEAEVMRLRANAARTPKQVLRCRAVAS